MSRVFFILYILGSSFFVFGNNCDFPLHERTYDGAFGVWNKHLQGKNSVVVFDLVEKGLYKVRGLYMPNALGRHGLHWNYLTAFPTYEGNGVTQKIRHLRFEEYQYGCRLVLIGDKSIGGQEENHAGFYSDSNAFYVEWAEGDVDTLMFLDISPDQF